MYYTCEEAVKSEKPVHNMTLAVQVSRTLLERIFYLVQFNSDVKFGQSDWLNTA